MGQAPEAETRAASLRRLDETLAGLCDLYRGGAPADVETREGWTAREVLAHITFWHESFARNVRALVEGVAPCPLAGTYAALNRRSVDEMRLLTTAQVLARLRLAQDVIEENILSDLVVLIPYRKGSRAYAPVEHLDVVTSHVAGHVKAIQRSRSGRRRLGPDAP